MIIKGVHKRAADFFYPPPKTNTVLSSDRETAFGVECFQGVSNALEKKKWRPIEGGGVMTHAARRRSASLGGATVDQPPQFDWRHRPASTAVTGLLSTSVSRVHQSTIYLP